MSLLIAENWAFGLFENPILDALLAIFGVCFILINFVAVYSGLATLIERKVAAHMQHRVGPYRVGPHGILQWLADALKLILKEDIIPAAGDKVLFRAAPYVVMAAAFAVWCALPFGPGFTPADFDIGILYILAIGSAGVIGILMSGWASGSKWSLFGAMRAAAQIVSYEVPTGLVVLTMLLVSGSLNMQTIVQGQATGFSGIPTEGYMGPFSWNVSLYPPFGLIAFLVFYTAALAETNRTPFDIPEAESELVAGYHTEYSGIRFSWFFMAEYANMFAISAVGVALFLGGYLPPFPNVTAGILALPLGIVGALIGYARGRHAMHALAGFLVGGGIATVGGLFIGDPHYFMGQMVDIELISFMEGITWFVGKTGFLLFVMMWLRWTLPRYRVDQLMDLCWKKLTPLAFLCLIAIGSSELIVRAIFGDGGGS